MSVDDFCQCTPLEFQAVYQAWADAEQRRERADWERTRLLCTTMLQPYSKKRLEPQDVMRFAWDRDMQNAECGMRNDAESEKLSAKEIRERFEKVKREMGLG
jgi:hypothetical protein